MEDLKSERELLRQQLASERSTNENLQVLLSGERRKEFHAQQSGQERELEIQHLRRQVARLEADRWGEGVGWCGGGGEGGRGWGGSGVVWCGGMGRKWCRWGIRGGVWGGRGRGRGRGWGGSGGGGGSGVVWGEGGRKWCGVVWGVGVGREWCGGRKGWSVGRGGGGVGRVCSDVSLCVWCSLSQLEQLRALHSEHAAQSGELQRVKAELTAEKFHKSVM